MSNDTDIKPKKPEVRRKTSVEWVVASFMGLATVAAITVRMLANGPLSARESALFDALQFLLTLGFGWFSTRAISRQEFEQSLKRFAISAHRRVSDIDRIVTRLEAEVRQMLVDAAPREGANLRIVQAIVADTAHVVRSSSADWADVIGDELLAVEHIRRLEREKENLQGAGENAQVSVNALADIQRKIDDLQSSLPPRLQLEALASEAETVPTPHALRWMRSLHAMQDGLRLTTVTGARYGSTRDQVSLSPQERLLVIPSTDGALDVVDSKGLVLGRLQNNAPTEYKEFVGMLEGCFGTPPYPVLYLHDLGTKNYDGEQWGWFAVRLIASLLPEDIETTAGDR